MSKLSKKTAARIGSLIEAITTWKSIARTAHEQFKFENTRANKIAWHRAVRNVRESELALFEEFGIDASGCNGAFASHLRDSLAFVTETIAFLESEERTEKQES